MRAWWGHCQAFIELWGELGSSKLMTWFTDFFHLKLIDFSIL